MCSMAPCSRTVGLSMPLVKGVTPKLSKHEKNNKRSERFSSTKKTRPQQRQHLSKYVHCTNRPVPEDFLLDVSRGHDGMQMGVARPHRRRVLSRLERLHCVPHFRKVGVPRGCRATLILLFFFFLRHVTQQSDNNSSSTCQDAMYTCTDKILPVCKSKHDTK